MAKIVINTLSRVGASDLTLSPDGISAIKDKFGVTLSADYFEPRIVATTRCCYGCSNPIPLRRSI